MTEFIDYPEEPAPTIPDAVGWVRSALPEGYDVGYDFGVGDTVVLYLYQGDRHVADAQCETTGTEVFRALKAMALRADVDLVFPEDEMQYWRRAGLNRGQP